MVCPPHSRMCVGLHWLCKSRGVLGQSRITLRAGLLVALVNAPTLNICSNQTLMIQTHTGILLLCSFASRRAFNTNNHMTYRLLPERCTPNNHTNNLVMQISQVSDITKSFH